MQTALNARVAAGYAVGGTSAGLAVLGEFVYAAFNASAVSTTVMANPYDRSVTLAPALFQVPLLSNIITDAHFRTRDRMGRLLTFLARLQQDGIAAAPSGIAVDEGGGVGVTPGRLAIVFGGGSGAYFLRVTTGVTRTCVTTTPPTPLPGHWERGSPRRHERHLRGSANARTRTHPNAPERTRTHPNAPEPDPAPGGTPADLVAEKSPLTGVLLAQYGG